MSFLALCACLAYLRRPCMSQQVTYFVAALLCELCVTALSSSSDSNDNSITAIGLNESGLHFLVVGAPATPSIGAPATSSIDAPAKVDESFGLGLQLESPLAAAEQLHQSAAAEAGEPTEASEPIWPTKASTATLCNSTINSKLRQLAHRPPILPPGAHSERAEWLDELGAVQARTTQLAGTSLVRCCMQLTGSCMQTTCRCSASRSCRSQLKLATI